MPTVLRAGLLSDRAVALAGPVGGPVEGSLTALGARTEPLPTESAGLEEWARERAPLHGLVYDAAPPFAGGGEAMLQAALERAWTAVRAVAVGALIDRGGPGKVVLLAPPADAGPLAGAAAAALESLARTLSVEWARFGITATAVVPSPGVRPADLAELVCFLLSPAGDYFSGCRFDLGARSR